MSLLTTDDAIDALCDGCEMPRKCHYDCEFVRAIKELEDSWIPYPKYRPDDDGIALVTICRAYDLEGNTRTHVGIARYEDRLFKCDGVTAWMPLPEPYKGE